jgi:hypothetical protein
MAEWSPPPILGFTNYAADLARVVWKDGSAVCGGILGRLDPEVLAQEAAERARKEELRQQPNVVLLEDYK